MRVLLVCMTWVLTGLIIISPAVSHPTGSYSYLYGDACGYGDGYGCGYGYSPSYYSYYQHRLRYFRPQFSSRMTRYESCSCHFGYEDGYKICAPRVSCAAEGGRCLATCAETTGN